MKGVRGIKQGLVNDLIQDYRVLGKTGQVLAEAPPTMFHQFPLEVTLPFCALVHLSSSQRMLPWQAVRQFPGTSLSTLQFGANFHTSCS